jgi:hypothetical protein
MDIYVDDSKFDKFVLFINDNKNKLDREDLIQYYNGGLMYNNCKLVEFMLSEFKYIIEGRYIEKSVSLLDDPKHLEMIQVFIKANININELFENVINKFMKVLKYSYTEQNVHSYLRFIIELIKDINKPDLRVVYNSLIDVGYTNKNVNVVLSLVDIFLLFGCDRGLKIDEEALELLFSNMDKGVKYILDNVDAYVLDLIKDILNMKDNNKLLKYMKERGKVRFITKIKEDFYVYNDITKNWCFDNDNIEYIKKHYKNPYNGEVIDSNIIDDIQN